jgi:hypothetical protein
MKDQSIRKLTLEECRKLAIVMGFCRHSLDDYSGRYVKIKLISPKRISGLLGCTIYENKNGGKQS